MMSSLVPTMRWILLIWFVVISLLIFIPSLQIWFRASSENTPPKPEIEMPRSLSSSKDGVSVGQVTAQAKWLEAYVKYMAEAARTDSERTHTRVEAYELVVKDTLAAFATSFITFLLGYAFVNTSGQVAARMLQEPEERPKSQAIEPL